MYLTSTASVACEKMQETNETCVSIGHQNNKHDFSDALARETSNVRNVQISEALQVQIEVQRRLHEQLEVQYPLSKFTQCIDYKKNIKT